MLRPDSGQVVQVHSDINMNNENITDLHNPVNDQDAATKAYVDDHTGASFSANTWAADSDYDAGDIAPK